MSTAYRTEPVLVRSELDGLTEADGVWVDHTVPETTDTNYVLTDGASYFHAAISGVDVVGYWRYGANDVEGMIEDLENAFGVYFISEYDEEYDDIFEDDDEF